MVSPDEPVRKNSDAEAYGNRFSENIRGGEKFYRALFLFFSGLRILRGLRVASTKQNSFLKNGTGFGDVGIERFDDGGILLLDDAALELEGEGEATVVERKIFGEKSEALDGFVLREMNGEALDLGVD